MAFRTAFVTIGQSPRSDLTPGILARLDGDFEAVEFGALDALDAAQISALAPAPGESRLVTRLRSGQEVVIGKNQTQARLQGLFNELDAANFDALVLLCTGYFPGLTAKTLLVEAQRIVDHITQALAEDVTRLGVMVPHEAQIGEMHNCAPPGVNVRGTHASPYTGDRFAAAASELSDCDLIVMHCMGYSEAQRAQVMKHTKKPVLLAQRMLAAGIDQLL